MKEEWNDYVWNHPNGGVFHLWEWREIIEECFGFKPYYLVSKDDGKINGILPLFEIKQLIGNKLVSLPFTTEGGMLYDNEESKNQLIQKLKNLTKERGLDYAELRQENEVECDLEKREGFFHLKLKLDSKDEVWKGMDKKARNAIRKAERSGLETDKGKKYFDEFYKIFSINMRDLGTPVDKKKFFEKIIEKFGDRIELVVGKFKGKVIGCLFLFKYKGRVKCEWASSYRKYFGYNVNQLMYWNAIKDLCDENYEVFDFGRSMEGEGTYKFKRKFGAEPFKLNYMYYINKNSPPDTSKDSEKRKLFSYMWKKVPLPIANILGPHLRKEFP